MKIKKYLAWLVPLCLLVLWIIDNYLHNSFTRRQSNILSILIRPDIPNLITANYSTTIGYPPNVEEHTGKDHYQQFTIDEKKFRTSPSYNFHQDSCEKYKIAYLPHSKFVLDIETYSSPIYDQPSMPQEKLNIPEVKPVSNHIYYAY